MSVEKGSSGEEQESGASGQSPRRRRPKAGEYIPLYREPGQVEDLRPQEEIDRERELNARAQEQTAQWKEEDRRSQESQAVLEQEEKLRQQANEIKNEKAHRALWSHLSDAEYKALGQAQERMRKEDWEREKKRSEERLKRSKEKK